jgi:predicted MFS family arabinose efflux permease
LLFLCALPNRLASIALGFYIAPLYLSTMSLTTSEIGRIVSIYALIMAFGTPIATKFVDKYNVAFPAVILGTLVAGLGMLALVVAPNAVTVAIAMACMGIGQSFSIPSQVYLAPWVAGESAKQLGATVVQSVFRTVERAPAFAGPLLGAALATRYGFAGAITAYGAYVTGCGIVLAGVYAKEGLLRFGEQPKIELISRRSAVVEEF